MAVAELAIFHKQNVATGFVAQDIACGHFGVPGAAALRPAVGENEQGQEVLSLLAVVVYLVMARHCRRSFAIVTLSTAFGDSGAALECVRNSVAAEREFGLEV